MKKFILVYAILFTSFSALAQDPDPDLFRTWYLYEVLLNDAHDVYIVEYLEPPITPNFTISKLMDFNGFGACNTFMGTYTYNGNEFTSLDLTHSNMICETKEHDQFEFSYFEFMRSFWYSIDQTSDGLFLRLENPLFGYALFSEFELSVAENNLDNINIYPNPVAETLFISSEGNPIEQISVFNINGMQVLSEATQTKSIDVSSLKSGLYFVSVNTSEGKSIEKFLKL